MRGVRARKDPNPSMHASQAGQVMPSKVTEYIITPARAVHRPVYPRQLEVLAQAVEILNVVSHSLSLVCTIHDIIRKANHNIQYRFNCTFKSFRFAPAAGGAIPKR